MKRLIFILISLLYFTGFSQVQPSDDFFYMVGKPYKVVDASSKHYFYQDSEVMSIKVTGAKVIIQKFNSETLEQVDRKEFTDLTAGFRLEHITDIEGRIYFFYSSWDKKNTTERLFYREIDFKEGAFKGDEKLIIKVNKKIPSVNVGFAVSNRGIPSLSLAGGNKFDFQYSIGGSKILVQYRVKPKIKNDAKNYDIIGLNVFDNELNLLWADEVKMPYTEEQMNNLDYSVDSDGNAYVLTTVRNGKEIEKERGEPDYRIELLKIKSNSEIEKFPLALNDKFINNVWIYEISDDYMVCAGFYSHGKDKSNADGILMFKVAKDGKTYDMANHEIPLEVINQYVQGPKTAVNKSKDKKGKAEFEDLVLRQLFVQDDGSIILIGEQYYMEVRTRKTGSGYTTYYEYHYRDMLITKINVDGELAWMKKLPKRQKGQYGRRGMSYTYVPGLDAHYLVFLDNVKNLDLPLDKKPRVHVDGAGGYITAYKVTDTDGDVKKFSILNSRDVDGIGISQFLTSRIVTAGVNEFVFEVYKKKKEDILIKVSFSD